MSFSRPIFYIRLMTLDGQANLRLYRYTELCIVCVTMTTDLVLISACTMKTEPGHVQSFVVHLKNIMFSLTQLNKQHIFCL